MAFGKMGARGGFGGLGSSGRAGASSPAGPSAVVLPTPSFGSSNLISWHSVTQTWRDSSGVNQPGINYDTIGHNSVASWYDISGNGYDWVQNDKSLQPTKGANGGAWFDQAGFYMDCLRKSMFNGLTQVTIYALMVPQTQPTGAKRTIIYASEGNTSVPVLGTPTVAAGGTGYGVGDQIVLTGGTASTQAILEVLTAPGGVIGTVGVINPGAYTVVPSSPVSQGSVTSVSGGASSGSGATFTVAFADLGNGSAAERLSLYLSTGSTGRKPYVNVGASDGTAAATSISVNQSFGPANGGALSDTTTKRRVAYEINMVAGTYQSYYMGAADAAGAQAIATGALGTADSVLLRLGNNVTPNSPLAMEILELVVRSGTYQASVDTYLASL